MRSVVTVSSALNHAQRWDFSYHDPAYIELLQNLDRRYPVVRFGDIITLLTDMGAFSLYKTEYFVDEGIPFLRVQNVQEYGVDLTKDPKYITQEYHKQLKKSQLCPGDLLITTKAVVGVAAVVDDRLGECNMSQNLVRIHLVQGINPDYVAVFLNSRLGRTQTETSATGPNQKYLNFGRIRSLRIPLPPRSVQDRIAQVMQDVYAVRRAKLAEAEVQLRESNGYVFDILGMAPEHVSETTRFLKSASELRGNRFDAAFNMGFHKLDSYSQQVQPMKAIASFPTQSKDPTREPDRIFKYIDIASIDILTGDINNIQEIRGVDAPSRARQVVHAADVIVSTVRPARGAIALITDDTDGFICSTGFCIVRANDSIKPEYLHAALRLSTTLEQFDRRSAGSSYPAILGKDVQETLIPIPDRFTQEKIAVEVSKRRAAAKQLRSEAEAVIAEAKARVERIILGEESIA